MLQQFYNQNTKSIWNWLLALTAWLIATAIAIACLAVYIENKGYVKYQCNPQSGLITLNKTQIPKIIICYTTKYPFNRTNGAITDCYVRITTDNNGQQKCEFKTYAESVDKIAVILFGILAIIAFFILIYVSVRESLAILKADTPEQSAPNHNPS